MIVLLLVLCVSHVVTPRSVERVYTKHRVGDMMLTDDQFLELSSRKMIEKSRFWPRNSDGIVEVPWKIEHSGVSKKNITKAMNNWASKTCVTFKEHTGPTEGASYLSYQIKDGCYAEVGKLKDEPSVLSLQGRACDYVGNIHELGHALGFQHEQSRKDREPSLIVVTENINPGDEAQFKKEDTNNYGVPYDYLSVMQYEGRAGARDDLRVMLATDARFQDLLGTAKDLSHMDLKLFNTAYGCINEWLESCGLSSDPCQNLGYLGSDCTCICKLGTSGDECEYEDVPYNEALLKKLAPLNKRITEPGTYSSPNYPGYGPDEGVKYIHVFVAPRCHKAVLEFEDFVLSDRAGRTTCDYDSLEVRKDVKESLGKIYCDKDLSPGTVITSTNQQIILHYTVYNYKKDGVKNTFKGYKLKFTTSKIEGCS